MNVIYPNGTGRWHVGSRALQVSASEVCDLIRAGVEFFFFDGGAFHVEHGRSVETQMSLALAVPKPRNAKARRTSEPRAATRILRVVVTDPGGQEFEVNNLLAWMRETFPEKYKAYYFSAIRGQVFSGYRVRKQGVVRVTALGSEEFKRTGGDKDGSR